MMGKVKIIIKRSGRHGEYLRVTGRWMERKEEPHEYPEPRMKSSEKLKEEREAREKEKADENKRKAHNRAVNAIADKINYMNMPFFYTITFCRLSELHELLKNRFKFFNYVAVEERNESGIYHCHVVIDVLSGEHFKTPIEAMMISKDVNKELDRLLHVEIRFASKKEVEKKDSNRLAEYLLKNQPDSKEEREGQGQRYFTTRRTTGKSETLTYYIELDTLEGVFDIAQNEIKKQEEKFTQKFKFEVRYPREFIIIFDIYPERRIIMPQ
jgi:hypothetical protein